MPRHRTTPAAYSLLHKGMEALAVISESGMRIDRGYLDTAIADGERAVADKVAQIAADPIAKVWRRRYREKTNFLAPAQMAGVIFGDLGYPSRGKTAKGGRDAADEKAFAHVTDLPIKDVLFEAKKIKNAVDNFLSSIRREAVLHRDGCWYVHPNFGLNTTITYRSSADGPAVQQMPTRNPVIAEMVRRTYIPRPGNQITEIDLGQMEARIMCPVTRDPALIAYISDSESDVHKDMAAQIFKCRKDLVSKGLRSLVKAAYVFATFYGSYWAQTAVALWEGIDNPGHREKLTDGTFVRDHLTALGFTELGDVGGETEPAPGTWAEYVRAIDRHFWGERFPVYARWKKDTFAEYLRDGGFSMLTGFAVNLPLNRKQVCNAKVQGPAFHVLLRALPLLNKWLAKYGFRTRVICEIHDACQFDGPPDERDDVIDMAIHYLTKDAERAWPWIGVPLVCEAECCPVNQSWYDKASLIKPAGSDSWVPADMKKWTDRYGAWELQTGA